MENVFENISETKQIINSISDDGIKKIKSEPTLVSKLCNEKQIYQFFLKIRSIFEKRNVERLYNEDLLLKSAKQLNKEQPPIINVKKQILDYGFYKRFVLLKESATYFSELVDFSTDELGEFYFTLAELTVPEFAQKANIAASPEALNQEQMETPKTKEILINALNGVLDEMDNQTREKIYESIYLCNWLFQFVKLPFEKFSSYFMKMDDGLFVVFFTNIADLFPEFCSILVNYKQIPKVVFDAIFEFNAKKHRLKNPQNLSKENLYVKYNEKTLQELTHINNFFLKDQLLAIGKIITGESSWSPDEFSFSQVWMNDLRKAWEKAVEVRWATYVQKVRKSRAFEKIQEYFKISEFPLLPNRPWTSVRQKTFFSKEYSSGFMNWFISNFYDDFLSFFRNILKEGDFINISNRNDYSGAINFFEVSSNQLIELNFKLAANGKFGQVFAQIIDGNMQYFRAQTHIETMMASIELEIQKCIDMFMKALDIFNKIFNGFVGNYDDFKNINSYEGLRNFDSICSVQYPDWPEKFKHEHKQIKHIIEIMKELIVIDGTQ